MTSLDDVRAAAARIAHVARRTPILDVEDPATGRTFALKCENLQRTGAFKLRGAYNMLAQLPPAARSAGVIAYSSGNHAQAVAYAAQQLGIRATIVMPEHATAVKVAGTRRFGADVIFAGRTSLDRQLRAEQEAAARGLTIVPPFDHPWIIAGAGTTGLEILEQCPNVAEVYVPMGGGGQIAGVSAAIKQTRPSVRIVGVEPTGAARMTASRAAGRPVTLERTESIADGLLTLTPGTVTFAHVQAFVDDVVTVDDRAIAEAQRWLFEVARLVAEPSGAASVAAVLAATGPVHRSVAIVSGGNVGTPPAASA
ncbi:MAG: threonine/serine dehydratase [Vicinamibacterales bacterium]